MRGYTQLTRDERYQIKTCWRTVTGGLQNEKRGHGGPKYVKVSLALSITSE